MHFLSSFWSGCKFLGDVPNNSLIFIRLSCYLCCSLVWLKEFLWLPHAFLWSSYNFPKYPDGFRLFPDSFLIVLPSIPMDSQEFQWFSYRFPRDSLHSYVPRYLCLWILRNSYGFPGYSSGSSGIPILFQRIPRNELGFPIVFLWFPYCFPKYSCIPKHSYGFPCVF